jgi:hypothetical protein
MLFILSVLLILARHRRIGVVAWADFTRAENTGIGTIFYPALGLAALLLTIGTAVAYRFDRDKRGAHSLPIYASAVLAITWALVTRVVLVPAMFALKTARGNAVELQQIFLRVARGSALNDVLHVVTFILSLWALAALCSGSKDS